eukprot:3230707-Karenia_brevis.AAC.1
MQNRRIAAEDHTSFLLDISADVAPRRAHSPVEQHAEALLTPAVPDYSCVCVVEDAQEDALLDPAEAQMSPMRDEAR